MCLCVYVCECVLLHVLDLIDYKISLSRQALHGQNRMQKVRLYEDIVIKTDR